MIAVADRVLCATQHNRRRARPKHRALRPMIKGVAMAIGRQNLALGVKIPPRMRQLYRHAPGQRHITFPVQQRLRCEMHRDQRRGTRRLQVDRRALQIKDMADPRGQKIFVIARMPQQEQARLIDQIRVRADVEIEIAAHPTACINSNGTGEILGRMACVFQRLPRNF